MQLQGKRFGLQRLVRLWLRASVQDQFLRRMLSITSFVWCPYSKCSLTTCFLDPAELRVAPQTVKPFACMTPPVWKLYLVLN